IKRSGARHEVIPWHRGRVDAGAQQVYFYQMDLALKDLTLFPQIKIAARFTGRLVARTEYLDATHELFPAVVPRIDLEKNFAALVAGDSDDNWLCHCRAGYCHPTRILCFGATSIHRSQ